MSKREDLEEIRSSPANFKIVLAAYLVQLVVPLFSLVDTFIATRRFRIHFRIREDAIFAGFFVIWLLAGLAGLLMTRDRKLFLRRIAGPLLSIYTVFFTLFLAEVAVRIAGPRPPAVFTVRPPGEKRMTQVGPSIGPGLHGLKAFTVNEVGLRGPSLQGEEKAYKIITIGGSTTEDAPLDDSEDWSHLLMQELNSRQDKQKVWVGNAGQSGADTVQHLILLQNAPVVKRADLLIFLVGINDFLATVSAEGAPTQARLERIALQWRGDRLGVLRQEDQFPIYRRLRLFQMSELTAIAFFRASKPRRITSWLADANDLRQHRAESPIVPLPDLQTGLREYRSRLLALMGECRALQVHCVFLTQPSMWRADLTPVETRMLWFGYVGPYAHSKGYVSAEDLERGMDTYNQLLLTVCKENGIECFDLAPEVPKTIGAFCDDCHFNEAGSRIVAHKVTNFLLSWAPFAGTKASAGAAASR